MIELMVRVSVGAITAAVLSVVLRRQTPELALLLVLSAGLWIVALCADALGTALEVLEELMRLTGIEEELLTPVVKTVAISLLTRLTVEVCRGAGEGGIAAFLEVAGTVFALGVSLPLIRAVVVLMGEMLG